VSTVIKWIPGSGTTNFRGQKVTGTASGAAITLHTAQASTTDGCADLCEVTVYNSDTVDRAVSFGVGGTTSPDDVRGGTVPAGEERTFSNMFLRGGLSLVAWASSGNVLTCHTRYRQVVFS
jgi:hypothetical protein